ncbi:hypothetical protein H5999_05250 [[Clostridium] spiroforme]|nr:hypothetical protein [Thomasclavelia spiroformis]
MNPIFYYFRDALKKLNSWIIEGQIVESQAVIKYRLSTSTILQINEGKYILIRDSIPVTLKKPNGQTEKKTAKVIDLIILFILGSSSYLCTVVQKRLKYDLSSKQFNTTSAIALLLDHLQFIVSSFHKSIQCQR